jgi:hypothetical protein
VSQDALIKIEVRLLAARYGRRRVIEALAAIDNVDLAVIESEIEKFEAKAKQRRQKQRRRKGVPELIEQVDLPDNSRQIVERMAYAYEEKQFLPVLRDVKRFLESQGVAANKLRSRLDALPRVIEVLARQSNEGLEKLVAESQTSAQGDLGVIADQILGRGDGSSGT